MLYAQLNETTEQMVGEPRELPATWTDGSGATIGKFYNLPDKILRAFGWVVVHYEELPDEACFHYGRVPVYDAENDRFYFEAIADDLGKLRQLAEEKIDQAASDACGRYISTGYGQEMRYLKKYEQARSYLKMVAAEETIDDEDPDLSMVITEAKVCNMTAQAKAEEIAAVHRSWLQLATMIESLRIGGKFAIRSMTDPVALVASRDKTISALEAI